MAYSSVKITGAKEIDKILSNLPDALQYKITVSAMRKAARPMVAEMRSRSPVGDRSYKDYLGNRHMPGNLKKSHGIVNAGSKRYPAVYVGPRYGKRYKYDGFYFKFIIEGSSYLAEHIKRPIDDWISRAGKAKQQQAENTMRLELGRALDRKMESIIRRHGGGSIKIVN